MAVGTAKAVPYVGPDGTAKAVRPTWPDGTAKAAPYVARRHR